ncbi:hypothetical protein FEK30_13250 [Picosynechococcus sp. PCC 11901]|uniref:hypothetical protein n=1 Tax=Picosynechococcus sp. PCC 11901 TaxID=2579791 RepID=UPI0010FC1A41|nr:hypothetical protein [Picosynechococcus sp. PCC 11901]QCS50309.1 hypothetical protein FEK30_13250 [Picosynechococcus sp. PCC 11901]
MATCDCSGASRAYVIVNPNSVNRREILSLNPPICHDAKTKGLLINGSPWTAPKEIQSWTPEQQQGGIRVDWGGGDVDILTGETWESAAWIEAIGSFSQAMSSAYNPPECGAIQCKSGTIGFRFFGELSGGLTPIRGNRVSNPYCGNHWYWTYENAGVVVSFTDWIKYSPCDTRNYPEKAWNVGNPGWVQVYMSVGGFSLSPYGWKITSNTGDSSTRGGHPDPPDVSLLNGDCILTITFVDNTTQDLTYDECPTVEPLQCLEISDQGGVLADICPYNGEQIAFQCDERKCPPETCCELECGGGRVCCYGPNSGTAIDSFIRRT